jgi:hypothetical protein
VSTSHVKLRAPTQEGPGFVCADARLTCGFSIKWHIKTQYKTQARNACEKSEEEEMTRPLLTFKNFLAGKVTYLNHE